MKESCAYEQNNLFSTSFQEATTNIPTSSSFPQLLSLSMTLDAKEYPFG